MKYLIVGLGNPGKDYENTRHNVGFKVVEHLAGMKGDIFKQGKLGELCHLKHKARQILLLKPNTYMNLSGKAVIYHLQNEKIAMENVLVVVDDIALPFGQVRIRPGGNHAGHNGLKSIDLALQSNQYPRLRIGIGNDFPKGYQADYVLGQWSSAEEEKLPEILDRAVQAVLSFCTIGIQFTMNQFNVKNQ